MLRTDASARRHNAGRALNWLLIAAACVAGQPANAAVFCVNTPGALQNALITAAANGESDEIRILVGNYLVPTSPTPGFRFVSSQPGGLAISGGWGPPVPVGAAPRCLSRKDDPKLTIIDGGLQVEGLVIQPGPLTGNVKVENLTILGGASAANGGGMYAAPYDPSWAGTLAIRTVVFRRNQAQAQGGGLYASVPVGSLLLLNSVFADNTAGGVAGGAELLVNGSDGLVANNTVVSNLASAAGGGLRVAGNASILVLNNALYSNSSVDVQLGGASIRLRNNFYNLRNGLPPLEDSDTLSGNPMLGGGTLGLAPLPGSPLIDVGKPAPGGLPPRDADGNQRIVGPAVDVGAYEEQVFANGMEGDEWRGGPR